MKSKKSILTARGQYKIAIISKIKFQLQPFTTEAKALPNFLLTVLQLLHLHHFRIA